jgi:hypothetical protein
MLVRKKKKKREKEKRRNTHNTSQHKQRDKTHMTIGTLDVHMPSASSVGVELLQIG